MTHKKCLAWIIILLLCMVFAACGSQANAANEPNDEARPEVTSGEAVICGDVGRSCLNEYQQSEAYPLVLIVTPANEIYEEENSLDIYDYQKIVNTFTADYMADNPYAFTHRQLKVERVLQGEYTESTITLAERVLYGQNEKGQWCEVYNLSNRPAMEKGQSYLCYFAMDEAVSDKDYSTPLLDGVYPIVDGELPCRMKNGYPMEDDEGQKIRMEAQTRFAGELKK